MKHNHERGSYECTVLIKITLVSCKCSQLVPDVCAHALSNELRPVPKATSRVDAFDRLIQKGHLADGGLWHTPPHDPTHEPPSGYDHVLCMNQVSVQTATRPSRFYSHVTRSGSGASAAHSNCILTPPPPLRAQPSQPVAPQLSVHAPATSTPAAA